MAAIKLSAGDGSVSAAAVRRVSSALARITIRAMRTQWVLGRDRFKPDNKINQMARSAAKPY